MVAQLAKTIKPKRLQVDAARLRVLNALRKEGNEIAVEFRKTVEHWRNPPKFEVLVGLTGKDATVVVGPTGNADAVNHWVWTDEGTEPHIIRGNPRLFFGTTGGKPKTMPGVIGSSAGARAGKPLTAPQVVNHPGTRARGFTVKVMSETRRKRFVRRLTEAAKVRAN